MSTLTNLGDKTQENFTIMKSEQRCFRLTSVSLISVIVLVIFSGRFLLTIRFFLQVSFTVNLL